jgi:hypothetical protein
MDVNLYLFPIVSSVGFNWLDFAAKMLVPILLAGVAGWFSYRQLKLREQQIHNDLIEKRFEKYQALLDYIGAVISAGGTPPEVDSAYLRQVNDIDLFFDESIKNYTDSVWELAVDLDLLQKQVIGLSAEECALNLEKQRKIKKTLIDQYDIAKNLFKPFLQVQI